MDRTALSPVTPHLPPLTRPAAGGRPGAVRSASATFPLHEA